MNNYLIPKHIFKMVEFISEITNADDFPEWEKAKVQRWNCGIV